MEKFNFIPINQKNIDQLTQSKEDNKFTSIIKLFIVLFIIYVITLISLYWFFVIQEKSKLVKSIGELDALNYQYYPKGNLEQSLFNINNLIVNFYDPNIVIKSVESSYIPNSNIDKFVYNKSNKTINIYMTVNSISDVTAQVEKFKAIDKVSNVNFSSTSSKNKNEGVSFDVTILLK